MEKRDIVSSQSDQTPTDYNDNFLRIAEDLKPVLNTRDQRPKFTYELSGDEQAFQGVRLDRKEKMSFPYMLKEKNSRITFDFGEHMVGQIRLLINTVGNPQDAPLKIKLRFGEYPAEVFLATDGYDGWISDTWFQEEILYIDSTPCELPLRRRYSFRYISLELSGISSKNILSLEDLVCVQQTSAASFDVDSPLNAGAMRDIDIISRRTLRDCMQDVFEDGPKRDRRLWLGDLRLQALANYRTYRNMDLVKRCLYLFAGTRDIKGRISSCIFTEPAVRPDTIYLFDYYLLFIPTLYEYVEASGDRETLEQLWPTALKQLDAAGGRLVDDLVRDDPSWWVFIDWNDRLNKQLPAQGVLIYCLEYALKMARILNDPVEEELSQLLVRLREKARGFFNDKKMFFVSGPEKQPSIAGQVWMILADVVDVETGKAILDRDLYKKLNDTINTPYLMHYYIEALFKVGLRDKAEEIILSFWGGMVEYGADTFWEVFKPGEPDFSPYGSFLINSYCHAWSCTPSYFISEYL